MKTSELKGRLLDYWVAQAEELRFEMGRYYSPSGKSICWDDEWEPSTNWEQGGPLIQKYRLPLEPMGGEDGGSWNCETTRDHFSDTPLQAICRAVVRAKFGDEVKDFEP